MPEAREASIRKKGTWCWAKYIERVAAASGVVNDKTGEMMWEKVHIEFARTTRGGCHSEGNAMSQWKAWEAMALNKDTSILCDFKGPLVKLRVWVHTADMLIFRTAYIHENESVAEGHAIKKPDEADLDKLRSDVFSNHSACVVGTELHRRAQLASAIAFEQ